MKMLLGCPGVDLNLGDHNGRSLLGHFLSLLRLAAERS